MKPSSDYTRKMSEILGVSANRKAGTPCAKEILSTDSLKELSAQKASAFRSAIGLAMYISQDRADIAFTVRLLSQQLKEPSAHAWQWAQRLASYLSQTRDYASMVTALPSGTSILRSPRAADTDTNLFQSFCDAHWSGNERTRRSMSPGSCYINGWCIYASCETQRCVNLSSTESELYALVSVACDGIFLKRVLEFVTSQRVKLQMRTDNQSCKQIARKAGVSKIRHLDGRYLWIQERVAEGMMAVGSVDGRINPPDLGSKVPASAWRLRALLFMRNVVEAQGDRFAPVGESEHERVISRFENAKQTMRMRLTNHFTMEALPVRPFACCCSAC